MSQKLIIWVKSGSQTGRKYSLEEEGDFLLGRSPSCDICLPDTSVSGTHAILRNDGRQWCVIDQSSRNGTILNGIRLNPVAIPLPNEGALSLANVQLQFRIDGLTSQTPLPRAVDPQPRTVPPAGAPTAPPPQSPTSGMFNVQPTGTPPATARPVATTAQMQPVKTGPAPATQLQIPVNGPRPQGAGPQSNLANPPATSAGTGSHSTGTGAPPLAQSVQRPSGGRAEAAPVDRTLADTPIPTRGGADWPLPERHTADLAKLERQREPEPPEPVSLFGASEPVRGDTVSNRSSTQAGSRQTMGGAAGFSGRQESSPPFSPQQPGQTAPKAQASTPSATAGIQSVWNTPGDQVASLFNTPNVAQAVVSPPRNSGVFSPDVRAGASAGQSSPTPTGLTPSGGMRGSAQDARGTLTPPPASVQSLLSGPNTGFEFNGEPVSGRSGGESAAGKYGGESAGGRFAAASSVPAPPSEWNSPSASAFEPWTAPEIAPFSPEPFSSEPFSSEPFSPEPFSPELPSAPPQPESLLSATGATRSTAAASGPARAFTELEVHTEAAPSPANEESTRVSAEQNRSLWGSGFGASGNSSTGTSPSRTESAETFAQGSGFELPPPTDSAAEVVIEEEPPAPTGNSWAAWNAAPADASSNEKTPASKTPSSRTPSAPYGSPTPSGIHALSHSPHPERSGGERTSAERTPAAPEATRPVSGLDPALQFSPNAQKELTELRDALSASESRNEKLQQELMQQREELKRLQSEQQRMSHQVQDSSGETQQLRTSLDHARTEAEALKEELRKAQQEAQSAQTSAQTTQGEAQKAQKDIEKAQADAQKAQAELQKVQAESQRLQTEHPRALAEIQRLQQEMQRAVAEINRLQSEMQRAVAEIKRLQGELQRGQNVLQQGQGEFQRLGQENMVLKQQLLDHQKELETLRSRLAAAQQSMAELEQQFRSVGKTGPDPTAHTMFRQAIAFSETFGQTLEALAATLSAGTDPTRARNLVRDVSLQLGDLRSLLEEGRRISSGR